MLKRGYIKIVKVSAVIMALAVAATLLVGVLPVVFAEPLDNPGYDVVAVIDASGSMGQAGNNLENRDVGVRKLLPAVDNLIDIGKKRAYPVNLGVVVFDDKSIVVGNKMWELTDGVNVNEQNAEDLKQSVKSAYDARGNTNQPDAVMEAVKLLEKYGTEGNKKLIVLFTDGADRGKEQSYFDDRRQDAIGRAFMNDITISAILFNPDDEDFGKSDEYSQKTGGLTANISKEDGVTKALLLSLFKGVGSGDLVSPTTQIEIPKTVAYKDGENFIDKEVIGFTIILEVGGVGNITLIPPLKYGISPLEEAKGDSRMEIDRFPDGVKTFITVKDVFRDDYRDSFLYGTWTISAENPQNLKITYYVIPDVGTPNPATEEDDYDDKMDEPESPEIIDDEPEPVVTEVVTESTITETEEAGPVVYVPDDFNDDFDIPKHRSVPWWFIIIFIAGVLIGLFFLLKGRDLGSKYLPDNMKAVLEAKIVGKKELRPVTKEIDGNKKKVSFDDLEFTEKVLSLVENNTPNEAQEQAQRKARGFLNSIKLIGKDKNQVQLKARGVNVLIERGNYWPLPYEFNVKLEDGSEEPVILELKLTLK